MVHVARSSVAAGLCVKVLVLKFVSMRSSRLPFWFATRMNEPSGAGNAACACRVPVLPTVVSKHCSGVRDLASKITTWPLATNESTACVCSLLNRIMCGRTGFLPVAARHSVGDVAAEIEPHGRLGLLGMLPVQPRAFVDQDLAAVTGTRVGLIGDPDLEAVLAGLPQRDCAACGCAGNQGAGSGRLRPAGQPEKSADQSSPPA